MIKMIWIHHFNKCFTGLLLLATVSCSKSLAPTSTNAAPQAKSAEAIKIPVFTAHAKVLGTALKIKDKAEQLQYLMEGSFSNSQQHKSSSEHIPLIYAHTYRVMNNHSDGIWLYHEVSSSELHDEPIRQCFYKIRELEGDTLQIDYFQIPADHKAQFLNVWVSVALGKYPTSAFEEFGPSNLVKHQACSLKAVRKLKDGNLTYAITSSNDCPTESLDIKGFGYVFTSWTVELNKVIMHQAIMETDKKRMTAEKSLYNLNRIPNSELSVWLPKLSKKQKSLVSLR